MLIDGVPYYESNYMKLDLNQIPVDNIAKIEVIKGGASVLYGANAMGGVINIITKKATEKMFTGLTMELGDRDSQFLSFTNGLKKGIFSYWFNYSYRHTDGWNVSDDFTPRSGTLTYRQRPNGAGGVLGGGATSTRVFEDGGLRDFSNSKANDVWLKMGIEPTSGGEYFVNLHYLKMEKGVSPATNENRVMGYNPATGAINNNSSYSTFSQLAEIPLYEDWGIDLDGKQKISDPLALRMKLFYHNHVDDYDSYADSDHSIWMAKSRYKDYILGGSLVADYKATPWDTLRSSLHYKKDSHKERDWETQEFDASEAFTGSFGLENEFTLVKNLSVVIGISYDWFQVSSAPTGESTTNDGTFNPMIGVNYAVTDTTKVFGSVAKKTRFPSLSELYSGTGGNDTLTSEKSINYTLGVSQLIGTWGKAEVSGFYHDISDRISRDNPVNPLSQYQNYASTQMTGFEIGGEVYPLDGLKVTLGYTYNYAQDRTDGRVTDKVTNAPENRLDLGIEYRVPKVGTIVNFQGSYVDSSYTQLPTASSPTQAVWETGDYFLIGGKVTQSFLKNYEAYVSVKNIFDKNYEYQYGYPGAGRSFSVGVSAKF